MCFLTVLSFFCNVVTVCGGKFTESLVVNIVLCLGLRLVLVFCLPVCFLAGRHLRRHSRWWFLPADLEAWNNLVPAFCAAWKKLDGLWERWLATAV